MAQKRTQSEKKRSESTQAPVTKPASADGRLLERARATLERGLDSLDGAIKAADQALRDEIARGKYDKDTRDAASHVAWMTNQAATVTREVRQIEAHDQEQMKNLSAGAVLEWYRHLDDDEKADFKRRLDSLSRGDSVLALG